MPGTENMYSMMKEPVTRPAVIGPMTVSMGDGGVAEAVARQDGRLAQSFGMGGADVVLAEHIQQAGTGDARQVGSR